MVGLCAGCNDLNPGGAFGIGALSGVTLWWMSYCVQLLGIDDPLDAFAVHYGGGICGVLIRLQIISLFLISYLSERIKI